jgi:hypothetical protein
MRRLRQAAKTRSRLASVSQIAAWAISRCPGCLANRRLRRGSRHILQSTHLSKLIFSLQFLRDALRPLRVAFSFDISYAFHWLPRVVTCLPGFSYASTGLGSHFAEARPVLLDSARIMHAPPKSATTIFNYFHGACEFVLQMSYMLPANRKPANLAAGGCRNV